MTPKLSIIVPTMNRPQFVERLLAYYDEQGFSHCIYIGDSSNTEEDQKAVEAAVDQVKGRVKAEYVHCPGMNNYEVMQKIAGQVSTPYVSYLADDDFLVPEAIEECIRFLDNHPDYFGACGEAVLFKLNSAGPYGSFDASSVYPEFGIEDNDAGVRLNQHLSCYTSTFHSVCRTEMMRKALRHMTVLKTATKPGDINWWTATCWGEILLSSSLVVQGKLKKIGQLHYIRQVHEARHLFPDWFDWITSAAWNNGVEILQQHLIENLLEQGGSAERAKTVVKQALWSYVARSGLIKLHKQNGLICWKQRVKDRVKHLPQLKKIWRFARSYKDQYALEAVLRPSSRLHKHFMPVYSLVSNEKERSI